MFSQELMALEHQRELLKEAEAERLVKLATAGRRGGRPLRQRAFSQIGSLLRTWGERLERAGNQGSVASILAPSQR